MITRPSIRHWSMDVDVHNNLIEEIHEDQDREDLPGIPHTSKSRPKEFNELPSSGYRPKKLSHQLILLPLPSSQVLWSHPRQKISWKPQIGCSTCRHMKQYLVNRKSKMFAHHQTGSQPPLSITNATFNDLKWDSLRVHIRNKVEIFLEAWIY